jgi:thiosulfate dehydrogenase [quinone] large subunit
MANKKLKGAGHKALSATRISLGLIFLWAFADKTFGLGFTTCRDAATNAVDSMCSAAWLSGGSPTTGFLEFGTKGPFAGMFQSLAGNTFVDWLYMVGLLGIGIGLTFGIAKKASAYSGVAFLLLVYLAVLPPEHHPLLDDHIIYSLILIYLANAPDTKWSLNSWYSNTQLGKVLK